MLDRLMLSRTAILFSNILLFGVLYLVNRDYAAVEHQMFGYAISDFSMMDGAVLMMLMAIGTLSIPGRIDRPSSLFLIIAYWFIVVPLQVLGLAGASVEYTDRYSLLFAVHFGFFLATLMNRKRVSDQKPRDPSPLLLPILIALWLVSSGALFLIFGSIMRISALDLIYEQREIGRASNFIEGYLQTYNQFVFSTALVAFGCYRRNYLLIAAGFGGAVMNYAITAEKASVSFPFFIIALHFMLNNKRRFYSSSSFVALSLSAMCIAGLVTKAYSAVGVFLTWYVGVRTLLTPGQQIILYADYFTERGYTYFSHIRGLDMLFSIPNAYASEVRWPSLGHMVGELHLNVPTLNSNANFIASDGFASFGIVGVIIVFLLFAGLVFIYDRITRGLDMVLVLPLLLPICLTLTNGSIFTVMTSFGAFFWILVFMTMSGRPKRRDTMSNGDQQRGVVA